jgi:hypothetical protein
MMDTDDTMDPAQVAALLRADPETIMQFARKGRHLPGARIGKGWVFLRTDVFNFLRAKIEAETAERRKVGGSNPENPNAVLVAQHPGRRRAAPPALPNLPGLTTFDQKK